MSFPGDSELKNPPAKQEIWVPPQGQEDPLEKKMTLTTVFLPGKPHGQRNLVGYSHRVGYNLAIKQHIYSILKMSKILEENSREQNQEFRSGKKTSLFFL